MRRLAFVFVAFCACIFAQEGSQTNETAGPPLRSYQKIYGYSGSNLVYICMAPSVVSDRSRTSVSITAASNAGSVSFTSTGHGFDTNSRPKVTISGGTGNWAAVNGTFTATVTSANAFTIPVDSTAFGALTGTLVFTTTAPRTGQPEWSVKLYRYDGSSNLVWEGWLSGSTGLAARCSDATSSTTNIQ